ncbi:MAG TPA: hypothetical protein VKA84_06305 [Gemmatimonadaceae bacterium]|nr:hypothetical protein [Gemmatimonadaceae bacterium]
MSMFSSAGIAERVRSLVNSRDRGDTKRASGRLGVPVQDLDLIDRLFADQMCDDRAHESALKLLAAVTRGYQADPCWLLTGHTDMRRAELSPSDRLKVADLLLRLGDFLVRERAAHRLLHAQPWARAC